MTLRLCRIPLFVALAGVIPGFMHPPVAAQRIMAPLDRGFARSSSISVNVEEMLGTRTIRKAGEPVLGPGYPALWIAEVQYKSIRLRRMMVTDPTTRKTANELVWYMVYRVIPRDYADLAGSEEAKEQLIKRLSDEAIDPQNTQDEILADNLLVPRFVLRTMDEGSKQVYVDEVNPQIQAAVVKREFRGSASKLRLLSSVDAISAVEAQVAADDPDPLSKALYGVAIWRNVDPNTDFFRVEMHGFSNCYKLTVMDDGMLQVEDKCIIQDFGRPGDQFRQTETEFRVVGNPKWIYKLRDSKFEIPDAISILGNLSGDQSVQ